MFLSIQGLISSKNSGTFVQPPMPTYVGKSTFSNGTGNVSVSLPGSLVAGDYLILHCETANQTVTAPSVDWTQHTASPFNNPSNATRITTFYARYYGGMPGVTITDPGDHCIANIYAFRGVSASGEGISTYQQSGFSATTAYTIPCGTTSLTNQLIVLMVSDGADVGTNRFASSSPVNASLTNLSYRESQSTTDGDGGGINMWTGEKSTAGSCGDLTGTLAIGTAFACISLALTG